MSAGGGGGGGQEPASSEEDFGGDLQTRGTEGSVHIRSYILFLLLFLLSLLHMVDHRYYISWYNIYGILTSISHILTSHGTQTTNLFFLSLLHMVHKLPIFSSLQFFLFLLHLVHKLPFFSILTSIFLLLSSHGTQTTKFFCFYFYFSYPYFTWYTGLPVDSGWPLPWSWGG